MSQHDYDIANQLSANLRIDLNNALQALNSNNSGTTEPTGNDSQANMFWYDTTNNILKMKPEDNAAGQWINIGYLDQGTDTFKILDDTIVATTAGVTAGLIGDQPTATWTTGTGTTESLVSPAKVKATVLALSPITTTSGSAPYYGCRGFVFIEDGSDAANTWTGENIASVVRNSTGLYTVTFSTAMPNANYAVSTGPNSQGIGGNGSYGMSVGFTAKSASSFQVRTRRVTDHDIFDCAQMSFSVFA